MRKFVVPVPTSQNLMRWVTDVHNYLKDAASGAIEAVTVLLQYQIGGEKATTDGLLMWDTAGYPVVSKDGAWRQIVLAIPGGNATIIQDTDITAAAVDTAYAIAYDPPATGEVVSIPPANPTRIVFEKDGLYLLGFTAQIESTSSSDVNFRFWPRINGTDAPGSTIVASLHNNGATTVVSRTATFQFSAGDYIEVMWATDSTSGFLVAHPATAYAPASPSTTLSINRVQQ